MKTDCLELLSKDAGEDFAEQFFSCSVFKEQELVLFLVLKDNE